MAQLENMLEAMAPGAGVVDFLVLLAIVVAVMVTLLLSTWLFFEAMNARYPQNKIQKGKVNARKWQELARAPGSILALSTCFAAGLFAQWQGWALAPLELSWWSGPLTLAASIVLYDAWFYWVHRLQHCRPMFRFHALHHRSVTPTALTQHHETVAEALLNQLYFAVIVFVLPIPWQMLVLHKIYDQISGILGHAGYEHFASPLARAPGPLASTILHDQHHSSFRYNFGHTFSWWDRLMGTLHPSYDATVTDFQRGGSSTRDPDLPLPTAGR